MHDNDGRLTYDYNMRTIYGIQCLLNATTPLRSPSWKADSRWASQDIPCLLWETHILNTMWGSNPCKCKEFSSSSKCTDQLWGPLKIIFRGYWGLSWSKAAYARCWLLISIYCRGWEWVELCLCSPYMHSWRGQGQLYLYLYHINATNKVHLPRSTSSRNKTGNVCITYVEARSLRPMLQWKSNTEAYHIFWVCICSLGYQVSNGHAPYCHLCGLSCHTTFFHIIS